MLGSTKSWDAILTVQDIMPTIRMTQVHGHRDKHPVFQ